MKQWKIRASVVRFSAQCRQATR